MLFKTSVTLDIYQTQSSTLAPNLLQDINKLLEKIDIPPGEKMTLKVQQKGKISTERSFN